MSLKDNYLKLTANNPYSLTRKGIKRGIIQSIMRGSMPKVNEAYEVAKALGVTVERLLIGKDESVNEDVEKIMLILNKFNDVQVYNVLKYVKFIEQEIQAPPSELRAPKKKGKGGADG